MLTVPQGGSTEWLLHYDGIQGFDFLEGYRYTLHIQQRRVVNPPADGSSVRWILRRVIDRQPVNH